MKYFLFILPFFLLSSGSFAQQKTEPTDSILVSGLVDSAFYIAYSNLANEKTTEICNFTVTNHLGEIKKEYRHLKGVTLLDLLNKIKITTPDPKVLSEYYLIFRGADGYAVVFSWNELFNTETGKTIYIVTEADDKSFVNNPDRILLISTKDFKTGRRHIKNLKSIEVRRI